MAEEHVFDLLPGYSLGCLDEDDLLSVARHLTRCPLCRSELETYWEIVDQVAMSVALQSPPAGLRGKILQRVTGAPQVGKSRPAALVPPAPSRPAARPAQPGWRRWLQARPLALAVAALALVLLAFLAISNLMLWQQVRTLQAAAPGGPARIVRLVGTSDAPQANGYLVVFPSETYGTLVVEKVPPLEPGYEYQLWLIKDGIRESGGVFSVGRSGYGAMEIWAEYPLDTYPSFGVTIEPEGGSPGPTGAKVLGGDL
jgi:anti-sigma-K factor RskA